jgi:hypothetical protein
MVQKGNDPEISSGLLWEVIYPRICPGLDEALRSCGLLLRQAMECAESQHQIDGMDAHDYTILE